MVNCLRKILRPEACKKIFMSLVAVAALGIFASNASADKTTVTDKLIGSTFKTLAKAFVATVNIEKLKKNNIELLSKKDEAKFRKQYVKIYKVIKECPAIASKYGLTEGFTKEQAIEKIKTLKKKDMYEALEAIPDTVIANQFRLYLAEKRQAMEQSDVASQIKRLWEKMTANAFGEKNVKKK